MTAARIRIPLPVLLCLLLAAAAPQPAASQESPPPLQTTATPEAAASPDTPLVLVRAHAEPAHVTIGDRLRYTIEVEAPEGTKLSVPVLAERIGVFEIVDFGSEPPRSHNGRVRTAHWYTLTTFDTGRYVLPAPTVQVQQGEGKHAVQGNEVTVEVRSVLPKNEGATDIRDIKPLVSAPRDYRPLYFGAASLAGLLALAAALWFLFNRPKKAYVVPPPPPHEIALRALDRLWARHDLQEGRWEPYYVELSSIVRKYLEERFHLRAPEMTTEEFLAAARTDSRLTAAQRELLADFLVQADLVKFARAVPSFADAEAAYRSARRFVDETKLTTTAEEERRAA
ncbi:MAG: BatD family protein [Candidatus Binatia bacterium]|nr:BatD family protein [Candidatus Binatia bacterium]